MPIAQRKETPKTKGATSAVIGAKRDAAMATKERWLASKLGAPPALVAWLPEEDDGLVRMIEVSPDFVWFPGDKVEPFEFPLPPKLEKALGRALRSAGRDSWIKEARLHVSIVAEGQLRLEPDWVRAELFGEAQKLGQLPALEILHPEAAEAQPLVQLLSPRLR